MDDLISRQDAINAINRNFGFNIEEEYGSAVQEVLNALPSIDAVPVIRCKDCKYWNGEGKYCDYDMSGLREDFCSWAERKES